MTKSLLNLANDRSVQEGEELMAIDENLLDLISGGRAGNPLLDCKRLTVSPNPDGTVHAVCD
jgi:hypothetical protein